MHNSNNIKHNYIRRVAIIALFVACILIGNYLLNLAFIPYSYVKVDYETAYNEKSDIMFIGTSHGKCAIQTDVIDEVTGKKSINMCLGGEYLSSSYYMTKDIITTNKPSKIVYELDYGYWVTKEYTGTDSTLIYRNMRPSLAKLEYFCSVESKKDFRSVIFPWYIFRKEYAMIPKNLTNKLHGKEEELDINVFSSDAQVYKKGGSIYRHPVADSQKSWQNFSEWDEKKINANSPKYFKKLVELCKKNDIELVVIITPVANETIDKYETQYMDMHEYFDRLTDKYDVEYINYNYEEIDGLDRTINGFCDYEGHMTGENAMIFSERLAEDIE